ncbi:MAG: disulfide bond formation protein B [Deltaproteobacteria bacterium]|jgi:disulfide bond formation protein DsbB|nr:disulfide bond formation protein B [Deltaproteobacteria bacterium]
MEGPTAAKKNLSPETPETGAPPRVKGFFARLAGLPGEIVDDFWGTLGKLQDERLLWVCGGLSALCLELFSYFYFQRHLKLRPCEYCVLIRFSMVVLFSGGMVGAMKPSSLFFKLPGLAISEIGAVMGLRYSIILENINLDSMDPDYLSVCSFGKVSFPLGIPMDEYFPGHFLAPGTCGKDTLWSFLDFNMTEWLIPIYIVYALGLLFMFAAWILKTLKDKRPPA